MTHPSDDFRQGCDLDWAKIAINNLTTAFYKTYNYLEAIAPLSDEFKAMVAVPEALMDLIANIQIADSWDQVQHHEEHDEGCVLCSLFIEA